MKYFDSHAHYYDERFSEECTEGVDKLLSTLFRERVSGIINVGTRPETCREAIEQAKKIDDMYTALGIHPTDIRFLSDMDGALCEIEELLSNSENKCVALGEIGLDYHYPDTNKELQLIYFEEQMKLAKKMNLPVVIHDRDAHADCMDILLKYSGVGGILHSFSGSADMARALCEAGYYISFSGTLTFTNARRPKEAAAVVPMDKILIETDCPYLAPHPLRGTLNHSGNLEYTNRVLAEIKGIDESACAEITEANARRIFGL